MTHRLAIILAIFGASPVAAAPDFVPSPKQAFEGFVAINAPRPDVPVGALWIEGFGPTGDAASADNLETVRSLNGLTIDRNLQLSLSAGLFDFVGIEPRLRDRFQARFGELTIVRIKDPSKLTGPRGEPRIIEAIKAGSVTVSSDGEAGLNARTGWKLTNYDGTTQNGRTRAYSIEGRDLFIAIRVATTELTQSAEREIPLRPNRTVLAARIDDFEIRIKREECPVGSAESCKGTARLGLTKLNSYAPLEPTEFVELNEQKDAVLSLPIPIADRNGGLYRRIRISWIEPCSTAKLPRCGRAPRMFGRYEGDRVVDAKVRQGMRW